MALYRVDIHFKNGDSNHFWAQEFDIDVSKLATAYEDGIDPKRPHRFSYKGLDGQDTPLYLTLAEVVGILVSGPSDTTG